MILREILILGTVDELEADLIAEVMADQRASFQEVIKYATIVLATGPIIIVYPFVQKYFVKGVMIGSLKE